jgi:hypothetical protein
MDADEMLGVQNTVFILHIISSGSLFKLRSDFHVAPEQGKRT